MLVLGLSLSLLTSSPDVVLVTIDTLRADHVGAYGSRRGATPNLDALAARGVLVEDAVVQVPQTRPSHASIFTGLYPFEHGLRDNASAGLSPRFETLATVLKAAGYQTAAFIGAYPVSRASGLARGFDFYGDPFRGDLESPTDDSPNERPASDVVDEALAWLRRPRSPSPLFLWVHLFDPHHPYEPPAPFASRFAKEPYDGEVAFADSQLKRLLDALDRSDASGRRLTVVTSDHGEGLGDHGEDEHHLFVYDSTLKVPLILVGAGLPRGTRVRGQFRSIDLMPTVLDLVGVTSPRVTGLSRAQNLRAGAVIPDNVSYAESLYGSIHFGYAPVRALRAEGFKYIDTPRPELYRVASDPAEGTNLAETRPPLSAAMQKQLRQVHGEDARTAVALAPVDQATQERLAALGYVAGGSGAGPRYASDRPDPKDRLAQYNRYSRGVNAALLARRRRDPAGVLKALLPVAPEFAANATVSSFLGEAFLESRRFTEAIPFLEKAGDASPTAWVRWGRLAEAYAGAGRTTEALDATDKGLAVSAKATDLIRLRVALLTRAGHGPEAMRFLEEESAANPTDGLLLAEMASLRRNAGDLAAADTFSARAVAAAPQKADAWLSRGLVLGALGRTLDAGQAFERATLLDPKSADAWFYAAAVEIQKGNGPRALELLSRVRELDPARPGLSGVIAAARGAGPATPPASIQRPPGTIRLFAVRCRTRDEASAIRARTVKGEDLLAIVGSLAAADGPRGDDLGWVRPADLKPPLNTAAAELQPGALSPVLELPDGFVILKRIQ